MPLSLPKLYPITDARITGLSHAEQVERLAAGGATFIQLREKIASPREFYESALEAVRVARRLGVRVIINDRLDIAIAVGADGAHLGQDDLPPERARAVAGESLIIGFSTHTLKQALEADSAPVDYIAIGPVFQTSTKANPDPEVGLYALGEIKRRLRKPLVAIGGITLDAAPAVFAAGGRIVQRHVVEHGVHAFVAQPLDEAGARVEIGEAQEVAVRVVRRLARHHRAARHAGIRAAAIDAPPSTTVAAAIEAGFIGPTPNSCDCTYCPSAATAGTAIAAPPATMRAASRSTSQSAARALAPSAIRIPISCVRCSTEYAIKP